jgi:hypothetical protein
MSLFRDALRPPAILSDQAIERYLAAVRAELAPDPLFRRRLRGQVMNRYVAAREGIVETPQRRSMGRVGRAVLYASFALAATTTSVLAASQEAVPGDLLYPLKRHVESLRVQVLPAHLQDDLAAYELAERIDELGVLAARGDDARVAGLAAIVGRDYEAFVEISQATPGSDTDRLMVLSALIERLPEPAQAAIAEVVERQSAPTGPLTPERSDGNAGGGSGGSQPSNGAGAAGGTDASGPEEPTDTLTPDPTPRAAKSPTPEPSPNATKSPRPDPTPRGGSGSSQSESDATDPDSED